MPGGHAGPSTSNSSTASTTTSAATASNSSTAAGGGGGSGASLTGSPKETRNADNDNDDDDESPAAASSSSSSSNFEKAGSILDSFLSSRRGTNAAMPEITLRLVESGVHGRSFWLTTARSLRDQGCTPQNSAKSILEVHCVRPEMLKMPRQINSHRILMRGQIIVAAYGANKETIVKPKLVNGLLADHFLFLMKKPDSKAADSVILLE
jgi:hypothetical protein